MTRTRTKLCVLSMAAATLLTGCPRPDTNAPVRITGDKSLAIPSTAPTTTTSTTVAPTTTLFYAPDGPGASIAEETTTTAKSAAAAVTTTTKAP